MTPETKIQLYNGVKDNTGEVITFSKAVDIISSQKLFPFINNIRINTRTWLSVKQQIAAETDPELLQQLQAKAKQYETTVGDLKKSLQAVTWSGTFTKRTGDNLKEYSGLICLDIDKLESDTVLQGLKARIKEDQFTFLVFTSPSGNGLKVVVKVQGGPDAHLQNFIALEKYYQATYQVQIDKSGKDVNRLCFLSADNDFRCNYNSEVFTPAPAPAADTITVHTPTYSREENSSLKNTGNTAADVWQITADYMQYADGQRNSFIYKFACNCNRKGVEMTEAESYALQQSDLNPKEVTATIRSAYTHNAAEWAKYAKKNNTNGSNKTNTKSGSNTGTDSNRPGTGIQHSHNGGKSNGPADSSHVAKYPAFWFETEDKQNRDEEGNPQKRYNIYYSGLIDFLSGAGYYRLPLPNKSYEFIRYASNVCDTIPLHNMRDYVMDWCKDKQVTANKESDPAEWKRFAGIREMLIRGAERYFNVNKLSILPYKKIEFIKDTKEASYFFFRNCYVKVTADDIETRPLTELQKTLWQADIIDRDFSREKVLYPESGSGFDLDNFNCEFAKYMALVSSNPKKYSEVSKETVIERFYSHCSAVGYMLHGWKNKIGKAIIAVDHKVPEDKSEQNGGTGKSIYGESFKYLKSTCIIDGREFKDDYPFRFERIGVDTKIVVMQDCRYSLDFGSFFVPITGDFTYNKRHTGYITLPYEDSPKWWFDTNFTFKGEGSSFRRRQHIIEFDDYFDENHNPFDEFGHLLFQDWDANQWNLFYNHYFQCVQTFLAAGLVDYPQSNYDNRRLLTETPAEFIDFFDASNDDKYKIPRNHWVVKKDLMKLWNEEAGTLNMQKVTPHMFSKWMKKYCSTRGLTLCKDKTNGVEYYMLTTPDYSGPKKYTGQVTLFNQPA